MAYLAQKTGVHSEVDEDGDRRPIGSTDALQDREDRSQLELLKAQALAAGFTENLLTRFLAGEDIFKCNGRHRSPGDGPVDRTAPCEGCQARTAYAEMRRTATIKALEARARAQGFTEEEIEQAKRAKDGEIKGLFRLEREHPVHKPDPRKPRAPDSEGQIAALEDLLNPNRIHGKGGRLDRAGMGDD